MRILRKHKKVVLLTLALIALILGICSTQFYVVELNDSAYEKPYAGFRQSENGDLAIVSKHFNTNSLQRGDLVFFDYHWVSDHESGVSTQVRVVENPPDAHTERFSWIEHFPGSLDDQIEGSKSSNVVIRGCVVCLIRVPWGYLIASGH